MKSIRTFVVLLVLASMFVPQVVANPLADPTEGGKYSSDVKERIKQRLKEKPMKQRIFEYNGELTVKPRSGKGCVLVVNDQNFIDAGKVEDCVKSISMQFAVPMKTASEPHVTLATVSPVREAVKAEIVIFIVKDDKTPRSLVAYDDSWAIINVGKLGDAPKPMLESRFQKSLLRTFLLLCGLADSQYTDSLMWNVVKPEDLDSVRIPETWFPTVTLPIEGHLRRSGVNPLIVKSYRKACVEGWAPAPTNEIQRVIWDKTHAIPSKPLKIEFDPKTDTK